MKKLIALLPALMSGQMNLDTVCKEFGMTRQLVSPANLETALVKTCEAAAAADVEVHQISGEWEGSRFSCLIVTQKKSYCKFLNPVLTSAASFKRINPSLWQKCASVR